MLYVFDASDNKRGADIPYQLRFFVGSSGMGSISWAYFCTLEYSQIDEKFDW